MRSSFQQTGSKPCSFLYDMVTAWSSSVEGRKQPLEVCDLYSPAPNTFVLLRSCSRSASPPYPLFWCSHCLLVLLLSCRRLICRLVLLPLSVFCLQCSIFGYLLLFWNVFLLLPNINTVSFFSELNSVHTLLVFEDTSEVLASGFSSAECSGSAIKV